MARLADSRRRKGAKGRRDMAKMAGMFEAQ